MDPASYAIIQKNRSRIEGETVMSLSDWGYAISRVTENNIRTEYSRTFPAKPERLTLGMLERIAIHSHVSRIVSPNLRSDNPYFDTVMRYMATIPEDTFLR